MKETFKKYKLIAIVAIVALLVGRYVLQPKVKVKIVEKTVYVEVFKEKKEEKKKVKTTIEERINTDGSKETTTVITDDSTSTTQTNRDVKIDSEKSIVKSTGSGLSLSLLAIKDIPNPSEPISFGAVISVPVFGNLNATGMVTTEKQVGLGLGITF